MKTTFTSLLVLVGALVSVRCGGELSSDDSSANDGDRDGAGGTSGAYESATIGSACERGDCDPREECFSGFYLENTVCTRECEDDGDCPNGSTCVTGVRDLDSEPLEGGYCLKPCLENGDCAGSRCMSTVPGEDYCF